MNQRPARLDEDAEIMLFLSTRDNFDWMINLKPAARQEWIQMATHARETTLKLLRAGVTVGTGTDIWQIPTGVHLELEQLVAAGLTPMAAIHAATGGAAQILGAGKELGRSNSFANLPLGVLYFAYTAICVDCNADGAYKRSDLHRTSLK